MPWDVLLFVIFVLGSILYIRAGRRKQPLYCNVYQKLTKILPLYGKNAKEWCTEFDVGLDEVLDKPIRCPVCREINK